jgi:hypothetical protein
VHSSCFVTIHLFLVLKSEINHPNLFVKLGLNSRLQLTKASKSNFSSYEVELHILELFQISQPPELESPAFGNIKNVSDRRFDENISYSVFLYIGVF